MTTGLGIRPELFDSVIQQRPNVDFLEAHSENYFKSSINRDRLLACRELYPVSLHGVGLSLGRADDLNIGHLKSLQRLVADMQPDLVSEHLAWSSYAHRQVPDLLPLPLTQQALGVICAHVDQMQDALGRQILIENPSNYLAFDLLQIPEPEFLNEVAGRTGCGLLLDINNVFVSSVNLGRSARSYLQAVDPKHVVQFHLAGHIEREVDGQPTLIDTHNQKVVSDVWNLYDESLARFGVKPTVIEWDSDFPPFSVLVDECESVRQRQTNASAPDELMPVEPLSVEATIECDSVELESLQASFLDGVFQQASALEQAKREHRGRLWVYQNNVFGALNDYLAEVYPATLGVVGEDFFKYLCHEFIIHQPPGGGDLYDYGGGFGAALADLESLSELPYFLGLTEFEWALHCAYFSDVEPAVDAGAYSQEALLSLPLHFNSSVWIGQSDYPVFEIHRQSLPGFTDEVNIDLAQSQDCLLVCKLQSSVHSQVIDPGCAEFLQSIKKSDNLLQAINLNAGSLTEQSITAGLAICFELGLLSLK